jgi:phospholipase C
VQQRVIQPVLGVGLQVRSLTVDGAPYTYTIGAGDELMARLPNPGTYDLSVHGPNGFFRHYAGSPATVLQVQEHGDHNTGRVTFRLADGGDRRRGRGRNRRPIVLEIADAYGPDRRIQFDRFGEITIGTGQPPVTVYKEVACGECAGI